MPVHAVFSLLSVPASAQGDLPGILGDGLTNLVVEKASVAGDGDLDQVYANLESARRIAGVRVIVATSDVVETPHVAEVDVSTPEVTILDDEPIEAHEDVSQAASVVSWAVRLSRAQADDLTAVGAAICKALAGLVEFAEPPTTWDRRGAWVIAGVTSRTNDVLEAVRNAAPADWEGRVALRVDGAVLLDTAK